MGLKEGVLAAGLVATAGGIGDASAEVRFNEWAKKPENKDQAALILSQNDRDPNRELAKSVIETGELTKEQVRSIHQEVRKATFNSGISGSGDYIQGDAEGEFNITENIRLGIGGRFVESDNVDQHGGTIGVEFTPPEEALISKYVINGQFKVSAFESDVKNHIANFDSSSKFAMVALNLKNIAFKIGDMKIIELEQLGYGKGSIKGNITDGSDKWSIGSINSTSSVSSRFTNTQRIDATRTRTTTNEIRNQLRDVDVESLSVILGLGEKIDVLYQESKDNLGEKDKRIAVEYRPTQKWTISADHRETRIVSGAEKQKITKATLGYDSDGLSFGVGPEYNSSTDDTTLYRGIQYATDYNNLSEIPAKFGRAVTNLFTGRGGSEKITAEDLTRNLGSLTEPVYGSQRIISNALETQTRSTTEETISEKVDNLAKGSLSNVVETTNGFSVDVNVNDDDGIRKIVLKLGNGTEKVISLDGTQKTFSERISFGGLTPDRSYTLAILSNSKDGTDGELSGLEELDSIDDIRTLPEVIEAPDPTLSKIAGPDQVQVNQEIVLSWSTEEFDSEKHILKCTLSNGSEVEDLGVEDVRSFARSFDTAGNFEFNVTIFNKADNAEIDSQTKSFSVIKEPVIEEPNNAPIANDNNVEVEVGESISENVIADDTDPDAGDTLSLLGLNGSIPGVNLTPNLSDGTVGIEATASAVPGTYRVPYTVSDGTDESQADLIVTVEAEQNVAPTFDMPVFDTGLTITDGTDAAQNILDLTSVSSDGNSGDNLTYRIVDATYPGNEAPLYAGVLDINSSGFLQASNLASADPDLDGEIAVTVGVSDGQTETTAVVKVQYGNTM
ncbi:hypothetical protein OAN96_00765 [Candidatus Gracilibacteria bacterium]|nr:hypothetical protein [Candidatus Gracilibacteria bacterium]